MIIAAQIQTEQETLVRVEDLKKWFPVKEGTFALKQSQLKAVDGVTFDIMKGETLGLVGESGCGKTTLGRVLICLERATSGTVCFDGTNIFDLSKNDLRSFRRNMQLWLFTGSIKKRSSKKGSLPCLTW